MNELQKARRTIDSIDRAAAKLFERRMEAAGRAAAAKRAAGLPLEDPEREEALIAARAAELKNAALLPYYEEYIKKVVELSKAYQRAQFPENDGAEEEKT